jgi:hypothetical protein
MRDESDFSVRHRLAIQHQAAADSGAVGYGQRLAVRYGTIVIYLQWVRRFRRYAAAAIHPATCADQN